MINLLVNQQTILLMYKQYFMCKTINRNSSGLWWWIYRSLWGQSENCVEKMYICLVIISSSSNSKLMKNKSDFAFSGSSHTTVSTPLGCGGIDMECTQLFHRERRGESVRWRERGRGRRGAGMEGWRDGGLERGRGRRGGGREGWTKGAASRNLDLISGHSLVLTFIDLKFWRHQLKQTGNPEASWQGRWTDIWEGGLLNLWAPKEPQNGPEGQDGWLSRLTWLL